MAPTVLMDQCPACSSSSRAKTDGPSKRGKHSQSTEPARLTSAAERQSDSKAYSAIGTLLMIFLLLYLLCDLDIDLDGFLVLCEVAQHLGIVFQALDTRGEQLVEPTREEGFSLDQVVHTADEVGTRGIHRSHHHFVAKYEALVDLICVYLDFLLSTRHTREHQDPIFAKRLRRLKSQRTKARGFKDDVEGPMHLTGFVQRRLL